MTKKKKPPLPPYVVKKAGGAWYVRRSFTNGKRTKNGKLHYTQIVRRCDPETPEHAAAIAASIEADWNGNMPTGPAATLGQFVADFVRAKVNTVSERTHTDYEALYKRYIEPSYFAQMPLQDIKPMDVQQFYDSLTVSGKMVRKLHTLLSMAFNQGIRWQTVAHNPCKGVMLPRVDHEELEIMAQAEARRFMEVCLNDAELYVLAFALETGMRPGEYLALRWSDVAGNTVKVSRALSFVKSGIVFHAPKTQRSRRSIELSETMIALLDKQRAVVDAVTRSLEADIKKPLVLEHMKRTGQNYKLRKEIRDHKKERLKAYRSNDLVFPAANGGPSDPRNIARRKMTIACDRAGLRHYSLYSLRHSSATLALAAGTNIKTVSERLGHAGIAITLQTYSHVLPSMRAEATSKLADLLY